MCKKIIAALMLIYIIVCQADIFNDHVEFRHFHGTYKKLQHSSTTKKKVVYRSGMNWTEYQDLGVIYGFMQEISEKYPALTKLHTIGKTYEGRDLKVLRISSDPNENKKIWVDGGIHAREWISPATVTFMMHYFVTHWKDQSSYVKGVTWYFMPVVNPDGYVYSRNKNRMWRKNRAPTKNPDCPGVDLNRNFDIAWSSVGSSFNPCEEDYHGPSAGSELETQAVTAFLLKNKKNIKSFLTYHSFKQLFIYPWSYKNQDVNNAADLKNIGDLAAKRIRARTGSFYKALPGHTYGIAAGGSDDWSRQFLDAKYVYTVELRDRGHYAFKLPSNQIIPTAVEGLILAKTVAEAIGGLENNS